MKAPPFEVWIGYVFDHHVTDTKRAWYWKRDLADRARLDARTGLKYVTRMFTKPEPLINSFSPNQIGQGLEFICGASFDGCLETARTTSLPAEDRVALIDSIFPLYQRLFRRICDARLQHVQEVDDPDPARNRANAICFMFWDTAPIWPRENTTDDRHIAAACLRVMERTLTIDHLACREGALHGLGHFQRLRPTEVESIIDRFLAANPWLHDDLRAYAESARKGAVL
ncbi:MAG: hypothetical protein H6811_01275 [Phycisphaeraceae bacterium]|nr:hypothetical protein [Phycisphaeraceae bacterium]